MSVPLDELALLVALEVLDPDACPGDEDEWCVPPAPELRARVLAAAFTSARPAPAQD